MTANAYVELLLSEGVDPRAVHYAAGRIRVPFADEAIPFHSYGFPPALLPLSSASGPSYLGYWKHWFVDRASTIVRLYVEPGYRPFEIARTFDQLAVCLVAQHIVAEGDVTAETRVFARALGIDDVSPIDNVTKVSGDALSGLRVLPAFTTRGPLQCGVAPEQYDGGFPHSRALLTPEALRRICGLELTQACALEVRNRSDAPAWLKTERQRPVFDQLLKAGDLAGAWLSLNSPGWTFRQAKEALGALADRVDDRAFDRLTAAWLAQPHERFGGY